MSVSAALFWFFGGEGGLVNVSAFWGGRQPWGGGVEQESREGWWHDRMWQQLSSSLTRVDSLTANVNSNGLGKACVGAGGLAVGGSSWGRR